jgi:hypothetical protein
MAVFDFMMDNPAQYEDANPDVTLEDIVQLHAFFYLLEAFEERWRRWVMFKCTCSDFFFGGCFAHSTLMALLYDSSLHFPSKYSSKQLPGRVGKLKRPSAWGEVHEEVEEAQRAQH